MDLVIRHVTERDLEAVHEVLLASLGRGTLGPIDVWRHRVTLVINLAYLAGIVLVPVGLAALFIRLSRRFLSS
jgi:hypothetical protein